ncbi:hypothetical protein J558_1888 [Acinetobacter baumannii 1106579]|nr:hypothetical protein ACINNAV82_2886 [Acinetobacter baumannii Naval-82]EXE18498.1 hypothetical protein J558_1888 [Acinetobacter baumannii 1106579]EXE69099.1 hypothetical protein J583_4056 [Acinetobacter baumannii 83444]
MQVSAIKMIVLHRIDDLERHGYEVLYTYNVLHRIDDLENNNAVNL